MAHDLLKGMRTSRRHIHPCYEKKLFMNILVYLSQENNEAGSALVSVFEKSISCGSLKLCNRLEGLIRILRSQTERYELAVLWVSTKIELAGLVELQELMENMPIILILPDQSRATLVEAHKLYPRLISFHDSDAGIVETVINKIREHKKTPVSP